MMRKIATALGYAKAPKASYVLRHPVKGTKALIASYAGRSLLKGKTGMALGAAVALPLAYMAVRSARR
jgi:ABC-type nitrate/sulfonate/bicarbonate transport system permease component